MEKRDLQFSASYTTISKYIDQLYDGFIPSVVAKVRTLDHINLIDGVKYQKVVPTVNSIVDFVAADTCSTFANGATTSIVGVTLTAGYLKMEESICLSEMEQYYFGQYMRNGSYQDNIPFEQAFMDEKMGKIAKKLDIVFWLGGYGVTGLIAGATAGGATSLTASSFSTSTAITNGIILTFDNMIAALNADMLSEELVLFVGQDAFDVYTKSIRNLNLYHFSPDEISGGQVRLFGKRNVTLVATAGLNGSNQAILTKGDFILWGTDLAPEDEPIKSEYNFYLDKFLIRYKVKIAAGIAFPTYAVRATTANT